MKIWVTRKSAFSIQCGGLERLFVWFRKPQWAELWIDNNDPLPFGDDDSDLRGRKISKWEVREGGAMWIDRPISFGKLFGYTDRGNSEDEIALYVWNKLSEHFGNSPFDKWHEYEKENSEKCCKSKFLIELDINVSF